MLSACQIEQIKQRLENTSPGPWKIESYECKNYLMRFYGNWHIDYDDANYEFISHAKNDVALLISELENCRNYIVELKEQIEFLSSTVEDLR